MEIEIQRVLQDCANGNLGLLSSALIRKKQQCFCLATDTWRTLRSCKTWPRWWIVADWPIWWLRAGPTTPGPWPSSSNAARWVSDAALSLPFFSRSLLLLLSLGFSLFFFGGGAVRLHPESATFYGGFHSVSPVLPSFYFNWVFKAEILTYWGGGKWFCWLTLDFATLFKISLSYFFLQTVL